MRRAEPTGLRAIARLALLLVGAALSLGCAQETRPDGPRAASSACVCEPASVPVVDPTLLAFLSKARAAHHDADLAEDVGDRPRAVRALERVVDGPRPGAALPSPEVAEVIADTRARLADLRSALGDFERASRDVTEGLALAKETSHFRGHLFEVQGVVEERRAKALGEKGDAAGAERAKRSALEAFEKAIEIQDEVIGQALKEKGSEPAPAPAQAPPH